MEVNELKSLLQELMQVIEQVVASGEVLSDEFQGVLANTLENLYSKIEESQELEESEEEQKIISDIVGGHSEEETPGSGGIIGQPPGNGGNRTIPPLDPAPHESSNINAFRYEPENQKLYVKFQGKYPQQNGPVYSYEGVPNHIFDVFARGAVAPKTSGKNAWHRWRKGKAPSHGASMYALIKQGGYAYKKIG